MRPRHIAVAGAGIIGLATAWKILQQRVADKVTVLEKEADVGLHQSGHNSGVLHAGLYYRPDSLKARLATRGIKEMTAFCQTHSIPHEICGKVVVATAESELPVLRNLLQNGTANGLQGLRWLDRQSLQEIEPNANGIAAVHVPEEGIVDYKSVCQTLRRLILDQGGQIKTGFRVAAATFDEKQWEISATTGDTLRADYIINCAGLYADRIARACGYSTDVKIIPFRGQYYKLRDSSRYLVKNLIYPVPDPEYPFLGVHFTRMIGGGVEAGPNAILAFAREGYGFRHINVPEFAESLGFVGLRKFLMRHKRMVLAELWSGVRKQAFLDRLRKLIPRVDAADLEPGGAGVRAQVMDRQGKLIQDFVIGHSPNSLHVISAPSPGATASLAIAGHLIDTYLVEKK